MQVLNIISKYNLEGTQLIKIKTISSSKDC